MRSILTLFWIIIIAGSIFIAMSVFKPDTNIIEDDIAPAKTTEDLSPPKVTETKVSYTTPAPKPKDEPVVVNKTTLPFTLEEIENGNPTAKTYVEHLAVGRTYRANDYLEAAIKEFLKGRKLNPNSTEPLKLLGETYLENNQPTKAKEAFLAAEKLEPNSIEIQIGIARALLNERKTEEAKNIVWALDKSDNTVKYYTGVILILYKDFEGAKNEFEEIVSAEPPASADLIEKARKFTRNFQLFEYFTDESPLFLQLLLAKSLVDVGEYEASIPLVFDVINVKSNYRDAWIVLGYAYLQTEKLEDALDALTKAKDLAPEKPETLFYLGLTYFAKDEVDKAIFYLEKADDYGYQPKDQLNLKLGDLYLQKDELEKAAKKYEETIALNPSSMEVFVKAVWLNIDKVDNPEKAMEMAEKALENFPDNAMSYNLVGWAKIATNEEKEAKRYLLKALEINSDFDAAYLNLGIMYEKQRLVSMAKENYKKAYTLGAGNPISKIALSKYNKLEETSNNNYYKADITSP